MINYPVLPLVATFLEWDFLLVVRDLNATCTTTIERGFDDDNDNDGDDDDDIQDSGENVVSTSVGNLPKQAQSLIVRAS